MAAVLSFSAIVSYVDRQVINLLIEPIKADLDISDTQISLIQGFSFAMLYAALALPIGRFADSGNRTHVIMIGIICWSVATFASGLAISIFTGSGFLGSGVALIIGAFVIDAVLAFGDINLPLVGEVQPWQLIFMLVAMPSILLLALVLCIKELVRCEVASTQVDKVTFKAVLSHINENKCIYLAIFVGSSLMASAQSSISMWVPSFFIRTYVLTASEIGLFFGALAAIYSTSGVFAGRRLATRLLKAGFDVANLLILIGATLLCIPFAFAFPLMLTASSSLMLLAPTLFFGAMPFGVGTSVLPQIAPNK